MSIVTFSRVRALFADDSAQGLLEYAMIIACIAVATIAALRFVEGRTANILNNASLSFPT